MKTQISIFLLFFCLATNAQQTDTDKNFLRRVERSLTSLHAKNIKVDKITACELHISYTMYFFNAVKDYKSVIPLKRLQILEDGSFYNEKGILVERLGKYNKKETMPLLKHVSLEVNFEERTNLIRELYNLSTKCK